MLYYRHFITASERTSHITPLPPPQKNPTKTNKTSPEKELMLLNSRIKESLGSKKTSFKKALFGGSVGGVLFGFLYIYFQYLLWI